MLEQFIIISNNHIESRLFKGDVCIQLASKQTKEPIKELAYLIKLFSRM